MPSKLSIYNGALTIIGERKLASLTENREPRYKLDEIWDNDMIDRCLQMGQWKFAKRTVELTASPSVTPSFGFQYAFEQPADHVGGGGQVIGLVDLHGEPVDLVVVDRLRRLLLLLVAVAAVLALDERGDDQHAGPPEPGPAVDLHRQPEILLHRPGQHEADERRRARPVTGQSEVGQRPVTSPSRATSIGPE